MFEVAHLVGGALIVAGLCWMRCSWARILVTQRLLADQFHRGRMRFECSLRAFGCAPFEDDAVACSRSTPLLHGLSGGARPRAWEGYR